MRIQIKTLIVLTLAAMVALGSGCGTLDLRPETHREAAKNVDIKRGKELLGKMAAAHGAEAYRKTAHASFDVVDDWSMAPFPLSLKVPFPDNPQHYELTLAPAQDATSLTFGNGALQGQTWTYEQGKGFRGQGAQRQATDEATIHNTVPSLGFFVSAPFRLLSADVVFALGQKTVDGKTFERVFLSWGKAGPQDDVDQFIAWIDTETFRLTYLEHTLRQFVKSRSGVVAFSAFRDVDGVVFPGVLASVTAVGGPPKIHRMTLSEAKLTFEPQTTAAVLTATAQEAGSNE